MIRLFSQNKKTLMLAAGAGLILLLVPLYFAEAIDIGAWCGCTGIESLNPACWIRCVAEAILSLPIRILFAILVGIIGVGALIAGLLYACVGAIVTWLIQVVMQIGTVPGSNVPGIVEIGWTFSRDFANLFFLLALAFIGLATVLKIREYEAKKALPTLIIIALLVNFTPVIVGFVVDVGNIITNFFLEQSGGAQNFGTIMSAAWDYLTTSLPQIFIEDGQFFEKFLEIMGKFLGIVIYGAVLFIFFNLAAIIYLVIGLIFFLRVVILWILMIIAPIAFLSKVFPDTKTTRMVFPNILHWDKWWETLIQWTIIGIPIAFFLYLSSLIMLESGGVSEIFNTTGPGGLEGELGTAPGYGPHFPGFEAQFISLVSSLLAPTVGLVLLIMGVLISIQGVPEGAKGVIGVTQKAGRAAGRWAGRRSKLWAQERFGPAAMRLGGRMEAFSRAGKGIPGVGGVMVRGIARPAAWASRALGGVMIKPFEAARAEIYKAQGEGNKMRKETRVTAIQASFSPSERAGLLRSAVESLDQGYTLEQLGEDEVVKIIRGAKEFESHKMLLRAFPHLAGKVIVAELGSEEEKTAIEKAVENITHHPEESGKYLSTESLYDPRVGEIIKEAIAKLYDGRFLSGIAREGGREAVWALQEKFEEKGLDWFLEEVRDPTTGKLRMRNEKIPLFLAGNAAQDAGFIALKGLGREQTRRIVAARRKEVGERERKRRDEEGSPGPSQPTPSSGTPGPGGRPPPRGTSGPGGGPPPRGTSVP